MSEIPLLANAVYCALNVISRPRFRTLHTRQASGAKSPGCPMEAFLAKWRFSQQLLGKSFIPNSPALALRELETRKLTVGKSLRLYRSRSIWTRNWEWNFFGFLLGCVTKKRAIEQGRPKKNLCPYEKVEILLSQSTCKAPALFNVVNLHYKLGQVRPSCEGIYKLRIVHYNILTKCHCSLHYKLGQIRPSCNLHIQITHTSLQHPHQVLK